jgi:hypothetical protein
MLQWGNRADVPLPAYAQFNELVSYPIPFTSDVFYVGASGAQTSNAWEYLCASAMSNDRNSFRFNISEVQGNILQGQLSYKWFAIGR